MTSASQYSFKTIRQPYSKSLSILIYALANSFHEQIFYNVCDALSLLSTVPIVYRNLKLALSSTDVSNSYTICFNAFNLRQNVLPVHENMSKQTSSAR